MFVQDFIESSVCPGYEFIIAVTPDPDFLLEDYIIVYQGFNPSDYLLCEVIRYRIVLDDDSGIIIFLYCLE